MEVKEQPPSNLILKVLYKKQTFNFGKNISSYAELISQTKLRFPEIKDVAFVFEEKQVTDKNLMNVLKEQQAKGLKSIKLELKETQFVKLQEKPEPSEKGKTKRYFFDSNFSEKGERKNLENQLKQQSKKSENPKKKSFSFNQQSEGEQDFENLQIDPDQIKITVEIKQESSRIKCQVGNEYFWSCKFTNEGKIQVPKSVYVRQLIGFKLIQIGGLKIGQTKEVTFGPYTETKEGQILHFFQIIYRTHEDTRYVVGSKFGFVCDAFKKIPVKEISNKLTDKVNELKNFTACEKSTLYIVAKMKEMGINDTTVDRFADEDLVDMIESFNEQ